MKRKFITCIGLAILMASSAVLSACNTSDGTELNTDVKPASKITSDLNEEVYEKLDFNDKQEIEFAERGFITAPDSLEIKSKSGSTVWSQDAYDFVRDSESPDTANPSLWRNTQLNAKYGLFEVVEGIYQVRGYDIANITIVKSDNGWIIFDCGECVDSSKAALELFEKEFGKAHIYAVVISHAHIDHFGGIAGLISEEDVADPSLPLEEQLSSGKTLVIVPDGFEKAAMEENVFVKNAMTRRSIYQYGSCLNKGETGSLSVGIGLTSPVGTTSYIKPSYEVEEKFMSITVDGLKMIFQLTPNTESPAEMNTYMPKYKALWMAENCTGTMHNLYTLRGAEVRDGNAWAKYIMQAKRLFGSKTEVIFQSHNWPHWGNDVINEYMLNTASVYKYIFSQTLQYINQGYTSTEIANMISLPENLEKVWYTRQYYGTLKHNVKAVYQKYMGWYTSNPVELDELEPSEYAKKLVEYLGDVDKVIEMAKEDYEKGEYQWVAEITNTLVYADPTNKDARYLCADALEQLGYQSESGAWRNSYLTAAYELRNGTDSYPKVTERETNSTSLNMSTDTKLDYLGICLDEKKIEDKSYEINLYVTDEKVKYLLEINDGVLLYSKYDWSEDPDLVIKTKSAGILGIAKNDKDLMDTYIESVEGNKDVLSVITDNIAEMSSDFNIVEP